MPGAFFRRWLILFAGLFALTSPFRYQVLPSVGQWLRPMLEAGLATIAGGWLPGHSAALFSDSPGLYAYAGLLAVGTALAAAVWAWLARRSPDYEAQLWYGLHTGVAWFVALHLLEYGFDKIFKSQFYLPEPNTLYTPLGQLSPDLAYWSVMGASHSYSVFAGMLEVLPGLLLLWGRTRLVGGILAVGVLANVVALNFGFDISVKLWSGFLLGLAGVVAAPGLYMAWFALVVGEWRPVRPAGWRGRGVGALRGLLLGVVLLETAGPFVQRGSFDDDAVARPPLHGAYAVMPLGRCASAGVRASARLLHYPNGRRALAGLCAALRAGPATAARARRPGQHLALHRRQRGPAPERPARDRFGAVAGPAAAVALAAAAARLALDYGYRRVAPILYLQTTNHSNTAADAREHRPHV